MDWADLRVFLAVARQGTLVAAARQLGASQPTMGRRIRALEFALGHVLFQRTPEGFVLTEEGQAVLTHAERMEEEALALARDLGGKESALGGLLRVTCSDWFGRVLIAPLVAEFTQNHPAIVVEMLTDARIYSLSRREADLAFRIAPFDEPDVVTRRLIHIPYGAYAACGAPSPVAGDGTGSRLVLMDTAFGGMPDVDWVRGRLPKAQVAVRSNSRDVQARLCAMGAGIAMLPRPLGDMTPGLVRLDLGEEPPGRDTHVGYHRDMRRLPRLRVLLDLILTRLAH